MCLSELIFISVVDIINLEANGSISRLLIDLAFFRESFFLVAYKIYPSFSLGTRNILSLFSPMILTANISLSSLFDLVLSLFFNTSCSSPSDF